MRIDRPLPTRSGRRDGLLLLALGVPAMALSAAALRVGGPPAQADEAAALPIVGSVTMRTDSSWTWSGPSICAPAASPTRLARTTAAGSQRLEVPLATLSSLTADVESSLVAVGLDLSCAAAVLRSEDDGDSWRPVDAAPDAVQADLDPRGTLWLVPRSRGTTLQRLQDAAQPEEVPVGCPAEQRLTNVAAPTAVEIYALCEDAFGLARTVVRSLDGGAAWEAVADDRSGAGLVGRGRAGALTMAGDGSGWLLAQGDRCAEGDLRSTRDRGETWAPVPCVAATLAVDRVLDVDVTGAGTGTLVGLRGAQRVVAVSDDDGQGWREIPAAD